MKKTHSESHGMNGLPFLLLALSVLFIGTSTVAYGQQFSDSFETAPDFGDFTLFSSPNSVTFTGGFTQTQGIPGLYETGTASFMVSPGNTATITFETAAPLVTLFYRDQFSGTPSVLTVFDEANEVITTINGTTNFVQISLAPTCERRVASMTLQNNGTGMAVIDDFSFTAGQAGVSTTLVADFMNGNDDVFNSRVYLRNSSTSDGEVCVRVFSLPLTSGMAQELTTVPLSLGTLLAGTALNVKLAEDIVNPLGLTLPYTTDGGNLLVEFKVLAADVIGAAQVFSSDFAFGTYPLQMVPAASAGSPTVLVANFTNGNNDAFNSRVYLFNPSASAGAVTVRVFTLPLTGGLAQELTTTPLPLGTLAGRTALNVKLAEDILNPLGIMLPYTTDGGNLTLEFTIQAADVIGAAQVFSSDFAFGTYPLQMVPAASAGSPTVLVANFTNGNNDAFNSRVYLFNPSASAGAVTVRVFTLPLTGGLAQELTATPLPLGTLAGRTALNVKLAEDILNPLGIMLPYTTDGGNLTLEFTIQAADVIGAAQVFSSDFAFGTYPLQVVPAVSAGSPTVLVANYMNGNSAVLNSRIYLWNPSASAGAVTVRVFTLTLRGSTSQELTSTPLPLGTLAARSSLNLKLAEDILTPLGLTPPYTNDGGNLTLEFTIQAADVAGAAQIFSSSFAFGTYPLQ